MKPHIKRPDCFCADFRKYGKDRYGNQKYMCKSCFKQYTLEISTKTRESKSGYPKCPVCGNGMYLHHKYKNHVSFKYNSRKCNHAIHDVLIVLFHYLKRPVPSALLNQLLQMA